MPTPHISALEGAFAKTVLMPGDPLRAQFIAENLLSVKFAEAINMMRLSWIRLVMEGGQTVKFGV